MGKTKKVRAQSSESGSENFDKIIEGAFAYKSKGSDILSDQNSQARSRWKAVLFYGALLLLMPPAMSAVVLGIFSAIAKSSILFTTQILPFTLLAVLVTGISMLSLHIYQHRQNMKATDDVKTADSSDASWAGISDESTPGVIRVFGSECGNSSEESNDSADSSSSNSPKLHSPRSVHS